MKKSFKLFKIAALVCATALVTGCGLFGNNDSKTNTKPADTTQ